MKKPAKKSNKKMTLERLAALTIAEINNAEKRLKEGIVKELRMDINEVKSDIKDIKFDLTKRVHVFDHKDLEFRVERLEEKVGITRKK